MMRSVLITMLVIGALLVAGRPALGAGHGEITVIPLGQRELTSGLNEEVILLPANPAGILRQPIVLVAAQPFVQSDDESQDARQVPATLKITAGNQKLPDWELQPWGTAVVVNLDAIQKNRGYADGTVTLRVEMASEAQAMTMSALGMPDPLLLKHGEETALNGPLALFEEKAADPDVKAYFAALQKEIAGEQEQARAEYDQLKAAGNARVARLARRGLRMLSYQLRERKLSGNFMEHYRWGLYLQFCGLFSAAFSEFEECRIIDPSHGDSQFRAGECLEQMKGGLLNVLHYMDRAGEAARTAPTYWHTLVVIQKTRGNRSLSSEDIVQIKNNWFFAEKMAWAASGGAIQTVTSFFEVENAEQQSYTDYPGGVSGPSPDIVETRGWFDSVISVGPRLDQEDQSQVKIAGGDVGPNGAAIASLGHDAQWPQYLEALYGQLRWAADMSECGPGLPGFEDAVDCGFQPTLHSGHAYRAALRYHFSPKTFEGLNIADVPAAGTFLRMWKIEGPFKVNDQAPQEGTPGKHVMDAIPAGTPETVLQIVSDEDYIDLGRLIPNAGWALARATSWVYSPEEQTVRISLGRNDGIALWVNGRNILSGRHYASGSFEDKNLVNTLSGAVTLKKGWNELKCVVESWPGKWGEGWGFSVSIVTRPGTPVPGLAYAFRRPEKDLTPTWQSPVAGNHYSWSEVREDYRRLLPHLSDADLRKITGIGDLTVVSTAKPWEGYVAIASSAQSPTSAYRKPPDAWKAGQDRDIVLNNLMDWARESCAALRYRKGDGDRDLLFLKPEAIEAFLLLLDEPESAKSMFGGRSAAERVLGYCAVPFGESSRTLLVVDAKLSDGQDWPTDEEDLLTPFGEYVPNAIQSPRESAESTRIDASSALP